MKKLPLFFALLLLLQSNLTQATAIEPVSKCPLPPPGWINATDITENSITIEWDANSGGLWYKITRFDVTNGIGLPDVFVPGTTNTYTSTPHAPGTTIQFGVSATSCDDQGSDMYGNEIMATYTTTWIVVDDIASFTVPGVPIDNTTIWSGYDKTIHVTNAAASSPEVEVTKVKVYFTGLTGVKYAEFLTWSQCSTAYSSAIRVQFWEKSSWPAGVTCTPMSDTTTSIIFQYYEGPFFTLHQAGFSGGVGQIKIRNNRPSNIFYAKIMDEEPNPCFVEGYGKNGGGHGSNVAFAEALSAENHDTSPTISETMALKVSPNPFSDGFSVDYSLETESPVTLALFDYTGRQVKTMQLPSLDAGNFSTSIYTNDLPAGIYQLSFQTNQVRRMTTLVKHQ